MSRKVYTVDDLFKLYKEGVESFGVADQLEIAREECGELVSAISDYHTYKVTQTELMALDYQFVIYSIAFKPEEFLKKYFVRRWEVCIDKEIISEEIISENSLELARKHIPESMKIVHSETNKNNYIVEVWS